MEDGTRLRMFPDRLKAALNLIQEPIAEAGARGFIVCGSIVQFPFSKRVERQPLHSLKSRARFFKNGFCRAGIVRILIHGIIPPLCLPSPGLVNFGLR